jgi:hypothetical protein
VTNTLHSCSPRMGLTISSRCSASMIPNGKLYGKVLLPILARRVSGVGLAVSQQVPFTLLLTHKITQSPAVARSRGHGEISKDYRLSGDGVVYGKVPNVIVHLQKAAGNCQSLGLLSFCLIFLMKLSFLVALHCWYMSCEIRVSLEGLSFQLHTGSRHYNEVKGVDWASSRLLRVIWTSDRCSDIVHASATLSMAHPFARP